MTTLEEATEKARKNAISDASVNALAVMYDITDHVGRKVGCTQVELKVALMSYTVIESIKEQVEINRESGITSEFLIKVIHEELQ